MYKINKINWGHKDINRHHEANPVEGSEDTWLGVSLGTGLFS